MPTIVHFDISADKPERARHFYESLFGWRIYSIEGIPDYLEIETTDLNGNKGIGGGITQRDPRDQTPIIHFVGVSGMDDILQKVDQLGDKVVQPRQPIAGYGFVALCADSEDNLFGVFEEDRASGVNGG